MKRLLTFIMLIFGQWTFGQLYPYKWSLGVHTGFSTYYGDLSPYFVKNDGLLRTLGYIYTYNTHYIPSLSWQVSLQRVINNSISLHISGSQISFSINDRFLKLDGTLWTSAPNFDRGLNVKTDINDLAAGLVFRTDNALTFPYRSLVAPYLGIYAVLLRFRTYADLTDDEGNFYNLSDQNIRENGVFETPLIGLRTEGIEYSTLIPGVRLDLGFRFRLSGQLSMHLSTQWTLAFSDYLDDVSGKYPSSFPDPLSQRASDPTDRRFTTSQRGDDQPFDMYFFHSVGFQWSFGTRKSLSRFPVAGGFAAPPTAQNKKSKFDPLISNTESTAIKIDSSAFNELQQQQEQIHILEQQVLALTQTVRIIIAKQQLNENIQSQSELNINTQKLNDSLRYITDLLTEVQMDTILPKNVRDSLAQSISVRKVLLQKSLDSLNVQQRTLLAESDSLQTWLAGIEPPDALPILRQNSDHPLSQQKPESPPIQSVSLVTPVLPDTQYEAVESKTAAVVADTRTEDSVITTQIPQKTVEESEVKDTMPQRPPAIDTAYVKETVSELSDFIKPNPKAPLTVESTTTETPQQKRERTYSSAQTTIRRSETPPSIRASSTPSPVKVQSSDISVLQRHEINTENTPFQTDTAFYTKITSILSQQSEVLRLLVDELKELKVATPKSLITNPIEEQLGKIDTAVPALTSINRKASSAFIPDFKSKTSIYFYAGNLLPDSIQIYLLRKIGKYFADSTESFILLTGYADNTGSLTTNLIIINQRLQNIRNILIEEGVHPVRIRLEVGGVVVRGRSKPNPADRRVDITFINQ